MAHALPGKTRLRRPDFESGELERFGLSGHALEPGGVEVSIVRLAKQPADIVALPVQRDDRFRFDAANHRLASHQIVKRDGRGIRSQAENAADQTV